MSAGPWPAEMRARGESSNGPAKPQGNRRVSAVLTLVRTLIFEESRCGGLASGGQEVPQLTGIACHECVMRLDNRYDTSRRRCL